MKEFIKKFIPPVFWDWYRALRRYGWKGNYNTWAEAQRSSGGYDDREILQKVKSSLLKVKNGEAVYERDSVLFNEIQYSWQLLAGLMYAAAKLKGQLDVLDFGGSLGSSYYQNKKFLDGLPSLSWSIVEQLHFVQTGKKYFQSNRLKFFENIDECLKFQKPNVLLLASVLQYLEHPYELLDKLLEEPFRFIILDRTPFSLSNKDEIKLQKVPPAVYNASYPCRFFSSEKLLELFASRRYRVVESFICAEGTQSAAIFKGFILEKKNV